MWLLTQIVIPLFGPLLLHHLWVIARRVADPELPQPRPRFDPLSFLYGSVLLNSQAAWSFSQKGDAPGVSAVAGLTAFLGMLLVVATMEAKTRWERLGNDQWKSNTALNLLALVHVAIAIFLVALADGRLHSNDVSAAAASALPKASASPMVVGHTAPALH